MKRPYIIMFAVSVVLVAASLVFLLRYGLNLGVDFTGGSVLDVQFQQRPVASDVIVQLRKLTMPALKELTVSPTGSNGFVLKSGTLTEEQHQLILQQLRTNFPKAGLTESSFDSVGPAIGQELESKAIWAVIMVLAAVIVYIALVFRAMRRVLSPWAMGFAAITALAHDVIIPLGVFAVLGHFLDVQVTGVFVAAILTILGYSVSDTVVVFDRVRENIIRGVKGTFAEIVHLSVMQTLVRSINTTLTVLISLIAILLFGGASIRYFALALIMGIAFGAYSSVSIASPLLVWLGRRRS